jgi:hypothetical protein
MLRNTALAPLWVTAPLAIDHLVQWCVTVMNVAVQNITDKMFHGTELHEKCFRLRLSISYDTI